MAVDAAFTILTKISGYLVAPIGRRFNYLTDFNKNVEMLRMQVQNLGDKRDGVQRAVDAATRNGEEIKADVQRWLLNVDQIMAEAERLDNEIDSNRSHLNGWHPDLRLRYKLSKEARRILNIVLRLQGGGTIESVSVPAPPSNIEQIERAPIPAPLQNSKRTESASVPVPAQSILPGSLPADTTGVEVVPVSLPYLPAPPPSVESMSVSLPAPPPGIEFMSTKAFMAFESTKSTMHQVVEALMDENCNLVGLYGMGGVGKTTLVKEVGKKVKEHKLFDHVVIAVVSQTPDVKKIQAQIADMLGLYFREESESGRAGRLYERLLKEKRVLLILDDVWARLDLKAVGIPHGDEHKGCKIILTTRRESICTVMGIQTKKIPVNVLLKEESWDLFKKNVGIDIDSSPLNRVAMNVVKECGSLPIALVTLGRALRGKDLDEWNAAVQQLKKSKASNLEGLDQEVFSCLRLSYDYLPDEENKLCFLFCCMFPEDYDIQIEYLARYGMGIGLFEEIDTLAEARTRAQTIVKYLKASCMLLDSDKEGCVKMHDMVRDVAISIASEGKHVFFVRAGAGLREWPKKETFESYTGISLMTNDIQELPKGLECPKLQILLLGENDGFEAIPDAFFEEMSRLRVLDLSERTGVRSLLSSIEDSSNPSTPPRILSLPPSLKFLTNLRTLYVDKCKLGNISALGTLKKLEILSFCGSDIKALPEEIGELINLRLLDLTFCEELQTIPANILSKLSLLEELYIGRSFTKWEVEDTNEERSNACLSELKLLPHLTILCVEFYGINRFPEDFLLPKLQKFDISIGDHASNCYPNSRNLYLGQIKAPLADRVEALTQLAEDLTLFCLKGGSRDTMVNIEDVDMGPDNILPEVDEKGLNGLKSLKVHACNGVESLINMYQWKPLVLFANLEELHLRSLDNIAFMCHGLLPDGSLEKLRVLKVEWCRRLPTIVPANLVYRLKNLEEISVYGCEELEEIFQLRDVADKEHPILLSAVRKLSLIKLPELFAIWNGSHSLVSHHNLTVVEILDCKKLKYLFPHSLAQNLLQLETLKIGGCTELETIIAEDEEGVSKDLIQHVGFPKLKVMEVRGCKRLTSLFTVAIAQGLLKLEELTLIQNRSMSNILSLEKKGEGSAEKEILLPSLSRLHLKDLQYLKRLCPESFTMELPSLKELVLEECHMMKAFAADAAACGLKSAPNLAIVEVGGQTLSGTAIQNLFRRK